MTTRRLAMTFAVLAFAAGAAGAAESPTVPKKKPAPAKLVDVNHAGVAQLKSLPGIGDAEAARIVAARPYLSKAELVTKNALPAGVYQSLRHRIVALQDKKPQPKAKP